MASKRFRHSAPMPINLNMTQRVPASVRDVSVVICAFSDERWSDLCAAVDSVRAQTVAAREIIVVIDNSEHLLERVRTEVPDVVAIPSSGGRGASCARNSGVAVARGEIVAFLDDDAEAVPEWIAEMSSAYRDDHVIGVGGEIEPLWSAGRPAWFPDEFGWVVGCTYRGMPEQPAPVRNLIAANMSMRRSAFEELGGFRPDFGKRGTRSEPEETELCIRAQRRWPDARWIYHPRAKVKHRVAASRTKLSYFVVRCFNEGLGKARMVLYSGTGAGLSSEREYCSRTLPQGVLAGVRDALAGDRGGLQRSATILGGFMITATSYLGGRVRYSSLHGTALTEAT